MRNKRPRERRLTTMDIGGFGFILPPDIPDELLARVRAGVEQEELEFEQRTYTAKELPDLYAALDRARTVVGIRERVDRILKFMLWLADVYERRQKHIIKKIAALDAVSPAMPAFDKPITVDTHGEAKLPEFKADDVTTEGL
jgi:hypothetical protein